MTKILIADDHPVVRVGLKNILLEAFPFAVMEEAADAEEMMKKIITSKWNLVISDLSMPGRNGIDAVKQIKQLSPELPVIILGSDSEDHYAVRALKAGAACFLSKDVVPDELVKAVRRVLLGKKYITYSIAEELVYALDHDMEKPFHECLSDREFDVFKRLAIGKSLSDIAAQLSLSTSTVSTYRARILQKMNMKTNADLVHYALENKLIMNALCYSNKL